MTDQELRARILETADKVRIERAGYVHAYGIMPNTNQVGWYMVGHKIGLKSQYAYEAAGTSDAQIAADRSRDFNALLASVRAEKAQKAQS